ncbi:tRNA lysidine(34) synthetase TilS [Sanguibacter sp. A247]|uniref:tRNA lysidine(34) synthetase TilS n=1 Tax=unclassified Sanguibacter TaxID=2645534 RepID=UPI003FD8B71F
MSVRSPNLVAGRRAVRATFAELAPGAAVVVGCSGGTDSLALVACLAAELGVWPPRHAARAADADADTSVRPVRVVVVDHGMQEASADVAERAAAACAALGLEAVTVRVEVDGPGGPEAAARAARYRALEDALDALPGGSDGVILLGHTRDDQAEGVLLGLARGAGARSLAGMRRARGRLRRPFLDLSRAVTAGVCAEAGLEPWHDPTNTPGPDDASAPRRSALRARVLPVLTDVLGPGAVPALARTAALLREDDDALSFYAERLLVEASSQRGDGGEGLDVAVLAAAPTAVRRRVLRRWAVASGATDGALARAHVRTLDALVTDWHGQGPIDLPGRIAVTRRCGTLEVHPPSP